MLFRILSMPFLLLLCLTASSQKMPIGVFRNISGDTIRQFVFRSNDSVATYYVSSTFTVLRIQTGPYLLKGNRLVLNAIRPICEVGKEQYADLVIGSYKRDSSLLEINFSLQGVSLVGKGNKSGKLYGAASNEGGLIKMTIANVDIPIKLTTGYVGYKNYEMIIDTIGMHRIVCPLVASSNPSDPEEGGKPTFIIKKHNQQEIVAREINERKFRTYRYTTKRLPPQVVVD
jgi:hypothetical protein